MRRSLNFVKLRGMSIFDQLKHEEILLRRSNQNWFIFNARSHHVAVVLGYSGKIQELVDLDTAHRDKVNLIRRYTGGGTVVVDENTVFATFVMNNVDVPSLPYPRDIMTWSENDVYGPVFSGVTPDGAVSKTQFSMRENDYLFGSHKIGGNAQSIIKDRWVHHTSFLWDYKPERMRYLQMPKKRPEYRADRDHSDFLSPMKDHLSSIEDFESKIEEQLSFKFDVCHWSESDLKSTTSSLYESTPQKDMKLLIRTKTESVDEHYLEYIAAKTLAETPPSPSLT